MTTLSRADLIEKAKAVGIVNIAKLNRDELRKAIKSAKNKRACKLKKQQGGEEEEEGMTKDALKNFILAQISKNDDQTLKNAITSAFNSGLFDGACRWAGIRGTEDEISHPVIPANLTRSPPQRYIDAGIQGFRQSAQGQTLIENYLYTEYINSRDKYIKDLTEYLNCKRF